MTITTNDDRDEYTATGGQTAFSYTFKVYASTDFNVYQTPSGQDFDDATDIITAYTVSGVGNSSGGTITLNSGATAGDRITIVSNIPSSRTTDYQVSGDFTPDTVNDDIDRTVSLNKQSEGIARRALLLPQSAQNATALTLPTPLSGQFLRWKTDGSGMENFSSATGTPPVSATSVADIAALLALTPADYSTDDHAFVAEDGVGGIVKVVSGAISDSSLGLQFSNSAWNAAGKHWARVITNGSYNVKWFGATGLGIVSDHEAVRDCIAAVQAATLSGNSGIWGTPDTGSGTAPYVYFDKGVYKASDYFSEDVGSNGFDYMNVVGDRAAIVADAGVIPFGGVGYNCWFEGLIFRDGLAALSIITGNVDSNVITVTDCEFLEQTDAHIISDPTSNSSILTVRGGKMMQRSGGGQAVRLPSCDYAIIRDVWIKSNSVKAFTIGYSIGTPWVSGQKYLIGDYRDDGGQDYRCLEAHTAGTFATDLAAGRWEAVTLPAIPSSPTKLMLENSPGIPGINNVIAQGRWADVHGELLATNFRFGGENGGATPIRFYGDGVGGVRIENCSVFASLYFMEFYALPEFLHVDKVNGFTGNDGLYFDPSITNEQFRVFQELGDVYFGNTTIGAGSSNSSLPYLISPDENVQTGIGVNLFLAKMYNKNQWQYLGGNNRLREADVLSSSQRQSGGGSAWAVSGSATTSGVDDEYLVSNRRFTSTADGQGFVFSHSDYLKAATLPEEKPYTFVIIVDSQPTTSGPLSMTIEIGGMTRNINLTGGRQAVSVPFIYLNDTGLVVTAMDRVSFECESMPNGAIIDIGRKMILDGFHNFSGDVLELKGLAASAPGTFTSYTNDVDAYFRGDIQWVTDVASAGHIARVCTVEGDAGTWRTYGVVS